MIHSDTLTFLSQLQKNNSTEWFKSNQPAYKASRSNFEDFVSQLIEKLSILDHEIGKQNLHAKKCIKRINRDVRFSNDKTPYKTNFFALFNPGGHKAPNASYYLHLEPGNSFIGGGVYMPPTPTLNAFRAGIDKRFKEWEGILNNPFFKTLYPKGVHSPGNLKTVPKGFNKHSPAIDYLRMKGFYTLRLLSDQEITSSDALQDILKGYLAVQPMIRFLNKAL